MSKGYICLVLGCRPIKINQDKFIAICGRCGNDLRVVYDMSYGDTLVEESSPPIARRVKERK